MEIGYENGNERMKMFRSVLSVYLSVYFNSKSRKFVIQIAAAPTMIYLFFSLSTVAGTLLLIIQLKSIKAQYEYKKKKKSTTFSLSQKRRYKIE